MSITSAAVRVMNDANLRQLRLLRAERAVNPPLVMRSAMSSEMTATEVLERSAEKARLLGAVYNRLQDELLRPILERAMAMLREKLADG